MSSLMEQQLGELGIMPESPKEGAQGPISEIKPVPRAKDHFNDPRDENGEVPF